MLTGVSLGLAAFIAAGNIGRRRSRALAVALVVWLVLVVLADLAALGAASLLRSGAASRLLITAAIVNPVGAARTGSLLLIEGTAAFGSASLALLRFAGGPFRAALWLAASLALLWLTLPFLNWRVMMPVIGRTAADSRMLSRASLPMAVPVRLPDLEHWKAQVKCQAGCPVSTDAGRYVQLIAEGRTRTPSSSRARRTRSRRSAAVSAPPRARTPAGAAPSMRRSRSAR